MTDEFEANVSYAEAYDFLSKTDSNITSKSDENSCSAISYSSSKNSQHTPPPNVAEGGIWGTIKNRNPFMISCAKEKEAYAVWGRMRHSNGREVGKKDILLFDTEGNLLGPRKNYRWVPKHNA